MRARQRMQQLQDLHLVTEIEEGGRFIQQDIRRLLRQRHGDPAALTLAAGQAFDGHMGKLRRAGQAQRLFHRPLVFIAPLAHKILPRETPARDQLENG